LKRTGLKLTLLILMALCCGFSASAENTESDSGAAPFDQADFAAWITELKSEAVASGIDARLLSKIFADTEPLPRVIELDRNQPEFSLTFAEYLDRVAPESRVEKGRRLLGENRELLKKVQAKYNVQPWVIVALWGIESDFGRIQGGFSVIDALVTLAYDGRRSAYFRTELLAALQILDEGHIAPADCMGSWAGAMGQCQFMPTSFVRNAVDFNEDGRRDIWQTNADVFASAAKYLSTSGWDGTYIWGRQVSLPDNFDKELVGLKIDKKLLQWQALGVRKADGADLPVQVDISGSLVQPDAESPVYLVYGNFEAVMKWNRSTYFATAVGILSDRIAWGRQ
jgi:peptidoglycan lytic transglycosylase B